MQLQKLAMAGVLVAGTVVPQAAAQFAEGDVFVGSHGTTIYRYEASSGNVSVFADAAASAMPVITSKLNEKLGHPPAAIPKTGKPVKSTIGSSRGFVRSR